MEFNYDDVLQIMRLLDQSDYSELCLELTGVKLSVRKRGVGATLSTETAGVASNSEARFSVTPPEMVTASVTAGAEPSRRLPPVGVAQPRNPSWVAVNSPTVGVFYRAPAPEAAPFVDVGSTVAPDDVVGIIEVMKVMNLVRTPLAGRISEIVVDNGGKVEYGEPLMWIEPAS